MKGSALRDFLLGKLDATRALVSELDAADRDMLLVGDDAAEALLRYRGGVIRSNKQTPPSS
jgi:hypothetical protein